jgi:hypothetical protein
MKTEHYIHTAQDKLDDVTTGKEFADKFVERFGNILKLSLYNAEWQDYLGHGFNTVFAVSEGHINGPNYLSTGEAMIWVESDIWPIKNEGDPDFRRSFTINYQLTGSFRPKYGKTWCNDFGILQFYSFSYSTPDEVLNKFEEFLNNKRAEFLNVRVKQNQR